MPRFSTFLASLKLSAGDKPIYLIAHNGKNYDFPVLESEVTRSVRHLGVDNLKNLDSLDAFRYYQKKTRKTRKKKKEPGWSSLKLDYLRSA